MESTFDARYEISCPGCANVLGHRAAFAFARATAVSHLASGCSWRVVIFDRCAHRGANELWDVSARGLRVLNNRAGA